MIHKLNKKERGDSGTGMIFGVVLLLVFIFFFFVFGLPMIRQSSSPTIQVPEQLDVNVGQGGK